MFCYVLPLGFVSGSHPSFVLFNLLINPIFKAYIEIMATYQSVNLSFQRGYSSVWFTGKASLCCTHAVTREQMPVTHWSWMFDLEVTKEGFSVVQTPRNKQEFLSSRVVDKEHHICFYLPQQELPGRIRGQNSRPERGLFLRPLLPPVTVRLHCWASVMYWVCMVRFW